MRKLSLGIDTSNYKTSVALTDQNGEILSNLQQYLTVKKGERGLRQSAALFQHVQNLPVLLEETFQQVAALRAEEETEIVCVSVSEKPRPVEGSYMPCFLAGLSTAKSIAAALSVPCYTFSHQEGHIEAARWRSPIADAERFISFHFSGGTSEALLVSEDGISIVGGSKDIAFGQVLDRVGVALGMEFPCGQQLDEIAMTAAMAAASGLAVSAAPSEALSAAPVPEKSHLKGNLLPKIKCENGYINLSGIETKCQRILADTQAEIPDEILISMLFQRISDAICDMTFYLADACGTDQILFAGGVSASRLIRNNLERRLSKLQIHFGEPALCTDNAAGIALLGGKKQWR